MRCLMTSVISFRFQAMTLNLVCNKSTVVGTVVQYLQILYSSEVKISYIMNAYVDLKLKLNLICSFF